VGLGDDELLGAARAARGRAYAPYSKFRVGAALLADGLEHTGANVENASYGLAICAERNAIMQAVLAGARQLEVIAVASGTSPPATPCGMCLQVMREFSPDPAQVRVLLTNDQGEVVRFTLAELLPHGFGPSDLKVD
jgi:cytidine deaminase